MNSWPRTASCRSRSISAPATRRPIRPRCGMNLAVLAKAPCPRAENAARACRAFRTIERRPARYAGRHAAADRATRRSRCRRARPTWMPACRCVVLSWPVINPLSRYRHAKRAPLSASKWNGRKGIVPRHDAYWRNEDNMAEGNPMLALSAARRWSCRRRSGSRTRGDDVHDYKDLVGLPRQRAAALYHQLPQGRRRHRARIYRDGAPQGPYARSVENHGRLRRHGEIRRQAHQSLSRGIRSPKPAAASAASRYRGSTAGGPTRWRRAGRSGLRAPIRSPDANRRWYARSRRTAGRQHRQRDHVKPRYGPAARRCEEPAGQRDCAPAPST